MNENRETNQGYTIIRSETYHRTLDREDRIVLGRNETPHGALYVTWESTTRSGPLPADDLTTDYFWGHYFMEDGAAAYRDYHLRLAEKYERS